MHRPSSRDSARLLLLDLIADAHDVDPGRLAGLDAAAWDDLARIGAYHRLEPLLHWQLERRHQGLPVPPAIRAQWKAAFVASSRRQLGTQYEIRTLSRSLTAAGIPSILLKGAFLAFHAYPDPALRPLRDIDILVPDGRVGQTRRCALAGRSAVGPVVAAERGCGDRLPVADRHAAPSGGACRAESRLEQRSVDAARLCIPVAGARGRLGTLLGKCPTAGRRAA